MKWLIDIRDSFHLQQTEKNNGMADEQNLPLPSVPSMVDEKEDHDPKENAHEQEPQLATVKMLLQSIGQTVTVAFPLRSPLNELLNHFAKELRMPPNILQITFKGNVLIDDDRLVHMIAGSIRKSPRYATDVVSDRCRTEYNCEHGSVRFDVVRMIRLT